ncbi:zinc-binding alcohol dehydrogenase family protein [Mucilaginibacter terrae]|uniref:2-desacetyl-2-hydroxyethyl bacteriochlorophyllide A dehydrogenase n=1 Tax=Mucilaginibacter terrae TaxID=1955052 RepID=A0ABU3GQG4_9SPHI|nr:zinc-binding alcohol dehydrogenase family protein [Mucilaginibacter terrae]MDT3401182.1 2-desacetyl-2-hydroxyethyl bacteriochlorophyllide A dehydrogenase [Mucilaginibacter terrae]
MKTLTCITPGQLSYKQIAKPEPRIGYSIIRVRRIGICGTDLHAYQGTQPFFSYPRVLGHELSGEVVDGIDNFQVGEKVTVVPYFNCGRCIACRSEKPNCCTDIAVCGVHIDGGMVEFLQVPSDKLIFASELSFDELALVEPLAIGAHGVRRANVKPGEFVAVIGAGPIGLGVMDFARIAGGRVIAIDINQQRLNFCKERSNVHHTINVTEVNAFDELKNITNGDFPTVVIDATGSQRAINDGFKYLAHGGRYVLVGLQKNEISVSHPEFHKREATLMSSRNATREDFEYVMAAMRRREVDPLNYITHRVSFDEVANEFPTWLDPENGVIKAMVNL